jgi:hypothetical protein
LVVSDAGECSKDKPADRLTGETISDAIAGVDGFTIADTPPPESDNEVFARLAKLPLPEYERARSAEATRMGFRTPILDRLVAALRGDDNGGTSKQGRALTLPAPEPWPEPVDGAALLEQLAVFFSRHIFLPPAPPMQWQYGQSIRIASPYSGIHPGLHSHRLKGVAARRLH